MDYEFSNGNNNCNDFKLFALFTEKVRTRQNFSVRLFSGIRLKYLHLMRSQIRCKKIPPKVYFLVQVNEEK